MEPIISSIVALTTAIFDFIVLVSGFRPGRGKTLPRSWRTGLMNVGWQTAEEPEKVQPPMNAD
jgi:hypothetical protein